MRRHRALRLLGEGGDQSITITPGARKAAEEIFPAAALPFVRALGHSLEEVRAEAAAAIQEHAVEPALEGERASANDAAGRLLSEEREFLTRALAQRDKAVALLDGLIELWEAPPEDYVEEARKFIREIAALDA